MGIDSMCFFLRSNGGSCVGFNVFPVQTMKFKKKKIRKTIFDLVGQCLSTMFDHWVILRSRGSCFYDDRTLGLSFHDRALGLSSTIVGLGLSTILRWVCSL